MATDDLLARLDDLSRQFGGHVTIDAAAAEVRALTAYAAESDTALDRLQRKYEAEVRALTAERDTLVEGAMNAGGKIMRLEAEVRALTARLDTAHTVIRKLVPPHLTEWNVKPEQRAEMWDYFLDERYTPAEAAEIRAATTDPTPHPDTDQ
jgi:hypothetical protein